MFDISQIQIVNLEITTKCQAACPLCPRNYNGYGVRDGFPLCDMTLDEFKHIFDQILPNQRMRIEYCGTFGDPCVSPYFNDIVDYVTDTYPHVVQKISTNGSMHKPEWWAQLARDNLCIEFGLDGLEDTHHIYRQRTNWKKIIENAKSFIDAGGFAVWQFIPFDHNIHQKEECKQLAKELGFRQFKSFEDGRSSGVAFTPKGEPFAIGDAIPTNLDRHLEVEKFLQQQYENDQQEIYPFDIEYDEVVCKSKEERLINVSANGDIWPCCWLGGTYPQTYDMDNGHELKQFIQFHELNGYKRSVADILTSFEVIMANPFRICIRECGKCAGTGYEGQHQTKSWEDLI